VYLKKKTLEKDFGIFSILEAAVVSDKETRLDQVSNVAMTVMAILM
jgi:hypothetical protein